MKRKGFYIRKGKELNSIYLNVYLPDFIDYLKGLDNVEGWVKLKIYQKNVDTKGFEFNMEQVIQKIDEKQ
jgi:HKD family nuclease